MNNNLINNYLGIVLEGCVAIVLKIQTRVAEKLVGIESLPGQVNITEEDQDFCSSAENSSDEDDFNLDKFHYGTRGNNNPSSFEEAQKQISYSTSLVRFMDVAFNLEYLQQRYNDPIKLLRWIIALLTCASMAIFVIFVAGFKLVPTLLALLSTTSVWCFVKAVLDVSNAIKIIYPLTATSNTFMMLYAFLVSTPFGSQPLFFLSNSITVFILVCVVLMAIYPNLLNANDPLYQTRFLVSRFIMAFFVTTGGFDNLSDVVLGVQLVRHFTNYLRVLGVVLFVLCVGDYVLLAQRTLKPVDTKNYNQILSLDQQDNKFQRDYIVVRNRREIRPSEKYVMFV